MGETTIEWTDATWNPVAGCSIASSGCTNCYAMRMAARLDAMGIGKYKGLTRKSGNRAVWTGRIRLDENALSIPGRWSKPRLVFVNSMSDLFHEDVPDAYIENVWSVMGSVQRHTYQILTKRPDRMARVLRRFDVLKNVWLGTSVEGPDVISRIDELRQVPASTRFISFEPLIDSVGAVDLSGISWAIVGGESGPRARPMLEEWVDEIEASCKAVGVAFFFKQWGGKNKKLAGRIYRGRTWDDLPEARI